MDYNFIKEILIDEAKIQEVTQYEIYCMNDNNISVETLKDEISSFASSNVGGVCFRCIVGPQMGYASTELINETQLRSLVSRAKENAKNIENDEEPFIFKGSEKYENSKMPPFTPIEAGYLREIALDIQKNTYVRSDKVTDGTQSFAMSGETEIFLYNSNGLELINHVGINGAYASAVVKDGEESSNGFEFKLGDKKEEFSDISEKAVNDALEKLNASQVETGKYNIIIKGKQMQSILSVFSSAFSSKEAQMGLSLLKDKENTKIASDCISIVDDPFNPDCPAQTHFDAEGVATYKKDIIREGTLKTLLYNLSSAKKADKETTANASKGSYASTVSISPYCMTVEAGSHSLDQLMEMAKDGIYITEVKGLHAGANPVTGDFSIESAGFLIENGQKTKPVKSFTIAGNFYDLLKNVSALSDKVEYGFPGGFTVFGSPAVLLYNMSIAGK